MNHFEPKTAAQALDELSEYKFRVAEVASSGGRKMDFPLWDFKKVSHIVRSACASELRVAKWKGFLMPMVWSIKRLKKAFPGTTTEVAHCKHPMTLCRFSRVVFRDPLSSRTRTVYRCNLSRGKQAVISREFSSTPAKMQI